MAKVWMLNGDRDVDKEQYYTPLKLAKQLLSEIDSDLWDQTHLLVEPSCGTGVFMHSEKETIGFDIEPKIKGANVHKIDFLTAHIPKYIPIDTDPNSVLCVGNPPFGRRSKLAKQFINKCFQFSNNVFMIVPISIPVAESGMNGLNPYIHIKSFKRLDKKIFTNDKGITMPNILRTAWVHFIKRDIRRPSQVKIIGGRNWSYVAKKHRILKGYVAVFRFSTRVVSLDNDQIICREAHHIVKCDGKLDIEELRHAVHSWRKLAKEDSTTGMLNITKQQLGRILNNLVR